MANIPPLPFSLSSRGSRTLVSTFQSHHADFTHSVIAPKSNHPIALHNHLIDPASSVNLLQFTLARRRFLECLQD